jgi:hypothetical protein
VGAVGFESGLERIFDGFDTLDGLFQVRLGYVEVVGDAAYCVL